jgi:hypothetical protein
VADVERAANGGCLDRAAVRSAVDSESPAPPQLRVDHALMAANYGVSQPLIA